MLSASLFICIKTLCSTISHRCTGNGMTQRHNRLPSCNGPSMSSFLSPFPKLYPEAEESQVLGFSFTGFYEHSTGEASAYNSNKNHRVGTKHGVEGMKYDSASNHSDHYGGIARNPTDLMMHGYDNVNLTNVQRSEYVKSKPSNSISNACVSMETKDRGPTAKMEKKSSGDRKARRQYDDLDELGMLSNEIMGSISGYCNVLRTFLFAFIASYEVNLRELPEDNNPILILDILCKIYRGEVWMFNHCPPGHSLLLYHYIF
ncbi:homeobox-DDT domain protein RLT1-like isoform X2 [Senna tora]|uniref:Homeobox-DDT domain protein RLT1-like isoform X2 n=1 Tax=Senna tora TaxID=362788 RepID=A0A834XDK9_9FABA|nr:homeobox-DDT domain protein RLT1-like isoform X2 [Senna tora]